MRLSYKLSFGTAAALTLATSVSTFIEVERETALYEQDLVLDSDRQARALAVTVAKLWTAFGDAGAEDVLEAANSASSDVRAEWIGVRRLLAAEVLHLSGEEIDRLRAGQPVGRLSDAGDDTTRAVAFAPVILDGSIHGVVELSQAAVGRSQVIARQARRAALTALAIVLASWLAATLLGRRWVGRPIERLVEKTRQVGAGVLDQSVRLDTHDELATLADALDGMSLDLMQARDDLRRETRARLEAMDQVRHADRLATIGQLAAGIAHELGTPLNVVAERTKMARAGELREDELPRTYDIVVEQTERMARSIRQLLDFSRHQPPVKSDADLRALCDSACDLLAPLAAQKSIRLEVVGPEVAPLRVDAGQIRQVLTNLLVNAIQATPASGSITLGLTSAAAPTAAPMTTTTPATAWALSVRDHGCGIEPKLAARIFEPFFTTKRAGEGTGLGLSIVKDIVEDHGGWLEVDSEPGRGSTFTVYLPQETARP